MGTAPDTCPSLVETVRRTLLDQQMFRPGDHVLVGFSGGPDSTALARVLMDLGPGLGFSLGLAHLNHGLRGREADRDEAFVREFAQTHALELVVEHLDIRAMAAAETSGGAARMSTATVETRSRLPTVRRL